MWQEFNFIKKKPDVKYTQTILYLSDVNVIHLNIVTSFCDYFDINTHKLYLSEFNVVIAG